MFGQRKCLKDAGNSKNTAPDYREYRLNAAEVLRIIMIGAAGTGMLSWLFYDSLIPGAAVILPLLWLLLRLFRKRFSEKRARRMRMDFLQAVRALGDAVRAGYSSGNAVIRSERELTGILPERSEILGEWRRMGRMIQNGETAEQAFSDFSGRSGISEIRDFSDMLAVTERAGGALSEVISSAARDLSAKEAVASEIRAKLSAKIMEQRIMDLVPAAILLYIRIGSPVLLRPMYSGLFGRSVMSGCLLLYFAAVLLSERILGKSGGAVER